MNYTKLRSIVDDPLWPTHLMRRGPILARLVFSNEKACISCDFRIGRAYRERTQDSRTREIITYMYSCAEVIGQRNSRNLHVHRQETFHSRNGLWRIRASCSLMKDTLFILSALRRNLLEILLSNSEVTVESPDKLKRNMDVHCSRE